MSERTCVTCLFWKEDAPRSMYGHCRCVCKKTNCRFTCEHWRVKEPKPVEKCKTCRYWAIRVLTSESGKCEIQNFTRGQDDQCEKWEAKPEQKNGVCENCRFFVDPGPIHGTCKIKQNRNLQRMWQTCPAWQAKAAEEDLTAVTTVWTRLNNLSNVAKRHMERLDALEKQHAQNTGIESDNNILAHNFLSDRIDKVEKQLESRIDSLENPNPDTYLCPNCHGHRLVRSSGGIGADWIPCSVCHGIGRLKVAPQRLDKSEIDPATGLMSRGICPVCQKHVFHVYPWWTKNPDKPDARPLHNGCFGTFQLQYLKGDQNGRPILR